MDKLCALTNIAYIFCVFFSCTFLYGGQETCEKIFFIFSVTLTVIDKNTPIFNLS